MIRSNLPQYTDVCPKTAVRAEHEKKATNAKSPGVSVFYRAGLMLIAGDIGGTTTRLALVSPQAGPRKFVAEQEFRSADYTSLEPIVEAFLAANDGRATSACFDVAGPVVGGRAHLTNLPWDLEEAALCRSLHLERVSLLNDLQAIAHSVPHLQPNETLLINAGKAVAHAPMAVMAPGTGLGATSILRRRIRSKPNCGLS